MPIFLYESVHLVPGQTVEYLRAFAERWLPLSDEYDSDLYTLSGFFQPDVLYNTQPTVNILWTIHSWEVWDGRHARGSAEEHLRKTHEFYTAAVGWRSGWTDKIIEPLSFSPLPPTRPSSARAGSTFFDHKFVVRPEKCGEFVDTFRDDVVPAATARGLILELFARAVGRPTEYIAIWSIPSGAAYTELRSGRDPHVVAGILPGFERAWPMLVDVEEHELTPAWFSPLGGSQVNPRRPTEEHMSI